MNELSGSRGQKLLCSLAVKYDVKKHFLFGFVSQGPPWSCFNLSKLGAVHSFNSSFQVKRHQVRLKMV